MERQKVGAGRLFSLVICLAGRCTHTPGELLQTHKKEEKARLDLLLLDVSYFAFRSFDRAAEWRVHDRSQGFTLFSPLTIPVSEHRSSLFWHIKKAPGYNGAVVKCKIYSLYLLQTPRDAPGTAFPGLALFHALVHCLLCRIGWLRGVGVEVGVGHKTRSPVAWYGVRDRNH